MAHFTTSNTEGYNSDELAILNKAFEMLADEGIDNDMAKVDDAITNEWFEGATADDLVSGVIRRIRA